MQVLSNPELVQKESIHSLKFSTKKNLNQHPNLFNQLEHAALLGNGYRNKVSIIFEDDEGLKRVDTTIWACGEKYICLKGGTWLPIANIIEVKY